LGELQRPARRALADEVTSSWPITRPKPSGSDGQRSKVDDVGGNRRDRTIKVGGSGKGEHHFCFLWPTVHLDKGTCLGSSISHTCAFDLPSEYSEDVLSKYTPYRVRFHAGVRAERASWATK
jgi:hypothetical protein